MQSHDRLVAFNNVQVLAKAAKLFDVPTIITTVAKDTFSGPFMPEITSLFPDRTVIDCTSMNSWLDGKFREAVQATGRKTRSEGRLALAPQLRQSWSQSSIFFACRR